MTLTFAADRQEVALDLRGRGGGHAGGHLLGVEAGVHGHRVLGGGRGITGAQNGFAIAGDDMSAASFLGIAGLIFLFGFDGFLYSVGFLVAFLTGALPARRADAQLGQVHDRRRAAPSVCNERPARAAAALGTLSMVAFYLIAQMVGAGVLIRRWWASGSSCRC